MSRLRYGRFSFPCAAFARKGEAKKNGPFGPFREEERDDSALSEVTGSDFAQIFRCTVSLMGSTD